MKYLVLLLLIFPFIEIYTLIVVGGSIGALNAVVLILLTGLIGAYLLRNKGIKTLFDIKSNQNVFEPSADNFLKTLFTPIGGFLLLVPGFITDFMGILILLPLTRIFILGLFFSYLGSLNQKVNANRQSEDWIEGEYKRDK